MSRVSIQPFADEHVEAAAELLAARHARHREAEPLLPARFEQPVETRSEIDAAWRADSASGAAAVRDGRLVGYLIGVQRTTGSFGRSVWVETASHAAEEAETVRDLYALAAERWAREALMRHYALVPATDRELVDAWFRLGFGQQQALGIRDVPAPATTPRGVSTRLAGVDDVDDVMALDLLAEHQALAPVFGGEPERPGPETLRADVLAELRDDRAATVLVETEGRVVGTATVAPIGYSSLHRGLAQADDACILGYAYTLSEVRGSGAGRALTEGVFSWAREHGFSTIVVDWRVTNLQASRFWPARGFRPTFMRLYRSIA